MVENDQLPNDSIYIRTRFPDWYEQEKVYLLDFNGRVKKKSMRNFQLMVKFIYLFWIKCFKRGNDSTEKKIIFQFGKVDKKTYILDYKEPFCEAQAFAIGLITYSWKENSEDK